MLNGSFSTGNIGFAVLGLISLLCGIGMLRFRDQFARALESVHHTLRYGRVTPMSAQTRRRSVLGTAWVAMVLGVAAIAVGLLYVAPAHA